MFDDYVNRLREELPDWRVSIYEMCKHSDGIATRTGEWEAVLGRSNPNWVVAHKDASVYRAFQGAMIKAQEMEAKALPPTNKEWRHLP